MKNWTITEKCVFITSILLLLFYVLVSFNFKKEDFVPDSAPILPSEGDEFKQYWYQGKAEITSFELTQARYGELRKGYATLVYVTEDFLPDKQVKNELQKKPNAVSVLKLNFVKKFITGIYDYSLMTSVFTPVESQSTLKVSSSVQEWCGHTYQQINLRKSSYEITTHSYFENEADEKYGLKTTLLEDEIWTKIRINPNALPTGEINLIPSTMLSRLKHQRLNIEKATATLSDYTDPTADLNELLQYEIKYPNTNRNLKIIFEKKFPHKIMGWEETYKDGWGENAPLLTTKATRKKTILSDYWTKNKVADTTWRKTLEIER